MNDWWLSIQTTFNNREIATGIWLLIAFILCLFLHKVRSGIRDIAKTFLQTKLLILFGSLAANIAVLCWLFSGVDLWTSDQLTPTVLWFFFSGAVLTGRIVSMKESQKYFKNLLTDSIKVFAIVEFLIASYSFGLLAELVLVPFMAFAGLMIGFSAIEKGYASVKVLFEWIAFTVVTVILWKSVGSIWDQPEAFLTTQTGRNFLFPALLSIGSIPFLYIWYCYSHIEQARIQIDCKTFQSDALKRYAKKRFYFKFVSRPWLLRRATRQFHTMPAYTCIDVDQIVEDVLFYERHKKTPPTVEESEGWWPYLARDFLKDKGLQTDDYHAGHRRLEWLANSDSVDLDNQILPNNVTYDIEGVRGLVTRLKLRGHFRNDFDPTSAKATFNEIALTLLERSISGNRCTCECAIVSENDFDLVVDKTRVVRSTDHFPEGKCFDVYFIFSRDQGRTIL